jgi:hypothetical protein
MPRSAEPTVADHDVRAACRGTSIVYIAQLLRRRVQNSTVSDAAECDNNVTRLAGRLPDDDLRTPEESDGNRGIDEISGQHDPISAWGHPCPRPALCLRHVSQTADVALLGVTHIPARPVIHGSPDGVLTTFSPTDDCSNGQPTNLTEPFRPPRLAPSTLPLPQRASLTVGVHN